MTTQQALRILIAHNKWRRDECDQTEQQNPRLIGQAIDKAIQVMEARLKRKAVYRIEGKLLRRVNP